MREDPDAVRAGLSRRGAGDAVDELLSLDARRRELLPEVEGLRAEQKRASQAIADAKRSGGDASAAIEAMQGVAARVKELQADVGSVEERLDSLRGGLPNLPAASAPDEDEVLREVGEAGATGRDHLELLGGLVDMEAGARLAGGRGPRPRGAPPGLPAGPRPGGGGGSTGACWRWGSGSSRRWRSGTAS